MKIRKAILPVAGMGTRFYPATKVVPKELLPIVDKPVIQYLVEEAVQSGVEEIMFVISPGKELIWEHFSSQPKIEARLKQKGKKEILDLIRPIHKLAKFSLTYQDEPKGDGHAILMAEDFIENEPFLVLFGDDIVKNTVPAARQLMEAFKGEAIMAVQAIAHDKVSDYGVIDPGTKEGRLYKVKGLVEKPSPDKSPSNLGIIGKYICPPQIFKALKEAKAGKDGEIRLIDAFIKLMETEPVWAYNIEGERFDTGKPEGLIAANQAYLMDIIATHS